MKIVNEVVKDCGDGHFVITSTIELKFKDTGSEVEVDVSTAYKLPRIAETIVFVNGLKDERGFEKILFEWRGINHAHAILEIIKFEEREVSLEEWKSGWD